MPEAPRSWFAMDVVVEAKAAEAIEFSFNELGSLGTEIDSLGKKDGEPLCVTGFFDLRPDDEAVRSAVDDALAIYGFEGDAILSISSRTVEETDWLAEWKKHWTPQNVGRFTIAPPWADVAETKQIVIRIEPNMAFGTGTHETTQLCLGTISDLFKPGASFLDVGTGTGVLAIAAAKLGGDPIFACDVDAGSVSIARENAVANDVADRIEFADGSIGSGTPKFDIMCANLTLDVIIPLLPLLTAKTRNTLILSGILAEQEPAALNAVRSYAFADITVERAGEWIAIIACRLFTA